MTIIRKYNEKVRCEFKVIRSDTYDYFPAKAAGLQREMSQRGWSGFLVTHNVDIYYYCGSMQTGYLFIPAEGEALYLVRRSLVRAEEEASAAVEALGSLKTLGERLRARCAGGMPRLRSRCGSRLSWTCYPSSCM